MSVIGSPSPVLQSGPLQLRPYTEPDEQFFVDLFQDKDVVRYVGDGLQSEEADRALFHRVFTHVYSTDKFAIWAVELDGDLIGHAELKPSPRDDIEGWELVYAIRRSHWRRGFGRLVAERITRYGLENLQLPAVFATVDTANSSSLALLAGLGFTRTAEVTENGQSITVLSVVTLT